MANPGDTLGPYVVEGPLARGGMGAVYRARNRITGQLRALKVVRPDLADEPDFIDRFVREASIASQLRHPNLVETYEPGMDGETIYLPMELLEGETLAQRLARVGRLSPIEAASIVVGVAEAMQLLHDRGLLHRDLKPGNVFLAKTEHGEVPKVIDLGAARRLEDDEHTRTGVVIGSPFYMAVEQAEGRRDIDARADQYALGVIAYQLLTGARPYENDDTSSAIAKLLRGDAYLRPGQLVPALPAALEQVVMRALERSRDGRFAHIAEFGHAFAAAAHTASSSALVDGGPTEILEVRPRSERPPKRRGVLGAIAVAATLLVVLVVGATVWAASSDSTEPAVEPATLPSVRAVEPLAAEVVEPVEVVEVDEAADDLAFAASPIEREAEPAAAPAPVDAPSEVAIDDAPAQRRSARARRRARRSAARTRPPCGPALNIPCIE